MRSIKSWYDSQNRTVHILIGILIAFIIILSCYKAIRSIVSRYNDDSPENAIRSEVMRIWAHEGSNYECLLYKSMFLKAEKVEEEEAEQWYKYGVDRETQSIYRISENCPNNTTGAWIVTELENQGSKYYTAKYGGF